MRRREFLRGAGVTLGSAAAGWLGAHEVAHARPTSPAPAACESHGDFDPRNWESVRDQFPLARSRVHLASFFLAAHPRPVAEAIERHRRGLDADPVGYWHEHHFEAESRVRSAAAEYLGTSADEIALTDSTTMGLGLVYGTLRLEAGQEILTTTHDHYSTDIAIQHRAQRTGAKVRRVTLYDDGARASVDEIVSRLRSGVSDRTRAVAVTWVHSSTGVKLPLAAMAAALREINAQRDPQDHVLLCVDGVHGLGIDDVRMEELGCDFFIAGTHKWLFGPRGTGLIWARPQAWKRAAPVIPSFGANYEVWLGYLPVDQVPPGDLMSPGGFHSFEHRWAVDQAFRFHMQIGKGRIQERIRTLNTMAKDALAEMPHIRLHTPRSPELSAGIICFEVAGRQPSDVVAHLRDSGIIASTSPYRESYARIAPSLVNNEQELERTLRELRALE